MHDFLRFREFSSCATISFLFFDSSRANRASGLGRAGGGCADGLYRGHGGMGHQGAAPATEPTQLGLRRLDLQVTIPFAS